VQRPGGSKLAGSGALGSIAKHRRSRHAWRRLFEQLQPFPSHAVFVNHEPGGVAARPRQTFDEAGGDGIGDDRKYDRHRARRLQQRSHGRGAMRQDDVRRHRGQFCRVFANDVGIASAPAIIDPQVAADDPSQLPQLLQERPDAELCFRVVRGEGQEHADAPHALGLLRPRRERPRHRRAAERR
jgi:hypothetical protein